MPRRRRPSRARVRKPRSPQEPAPGYTALGRVLRPHGIAGELRVEAFSPSARNLAPGRWVRVAGVRRQILGLRPGPRSLLLRLAGISSRTEAEPLRGTLIEARDDEVERDEPDSYFIHELVGLEAVTVEGEQLGTLAEVLQPGGAADVYVIQGDLGEILVPAIADVVRDIDVSARRIVIALMPGMLDAPR